MSEHLEFQDAIGCPISVFPEGTVFPGYDEPLEYVGLRIGGSGGGALVIAGSPQQILDVLTRAQNAVIRYRESLT